MINQSIKHGTVAQAQLVSNQSRIKEKKSPYTTDNKCGKLTVLNLLPKIKITPILHSIASRIADVVATHKATTGAAGVWLKGCEIIGGGLGSISDRSRRRLGRTDPGDWGTGSHKKNPKNTAVLRTLFVHILLNIQTKPHSGSALGEM